MVEASTDLGRPFFVGLSQLRDEAEGVPEVLLDLVPLDLGGCERAAGVGQFGRDPILFLLEEVHWDGTGEVCLEQLASFVLEGLDSLALLAAQLLDVAGPGSHPHQQLVVDSGGGRLVDLERLVAVDHEFFDTLCWQVRQVAGRPLLDPAEAVEVVVQPTAAAFGLGEREP